MLTSIMMDVTLLIHDVHHFIGHLSEEHGTTGQRAESSLLSTVLAGVMPVSSWVDAL
jgi:hypothetical protein